MQNSIPDREELIETAAKALVAEVGIPWEHVRQDPFRAAARTVIRIALEAAAEVADEHAAKSVLLSETAAEDTALLHGAEAMAAITIAAAIRARKETGDAC